MEWHILGRLLDAAQIFHDEMVAKRREGLPYGIVAVCLDGVQICIFAESGESNPLGVKTQVHARA